MKVSWTKAFFKLLFLFFSFTGKHLENVGREVTNYFIGA